MSKVFIEALLAERHGYVLRNLPDRVAAVNARLSSLGYHVAETATNDPQIETAARMKPTRRKKG